MDGVIWPWTLRLEPSDPKQPHIQWWHRPGTEAEFAELKRRKDETRRDDQLWRIASGRPLT